MGIPLNIDWQQILLHLFNFSILTAGLYVLLYKPVRDFMDKRTSYYKQMDEEAQEKLSQAAQLEASYKEQLSRADAQISQHKAKAALDAERTAEEQLKSARKQAEKILAQAQQDIAELAATAAEKLVLKSLDGAYDQFLSVAGGGEEHEKQKS